MNHTNTIRGARGPVETLSLRDIMAPLFRKKSVLVIVFVCSFLIATATGFLGFYKKYESHMIVIVNRERIDPVVTTNGTSQTINNDNSINDEEVNSEVELLKSRDVLEQVVISNGLQNRNGNVLLQGVVPRPSDSDRVAGALKALAKRLKIVTVDKTNLIDVTYRSNDPLLSYSVLKSLGDLYLAKHAAVHRPSGSYQFFEHETDKYKKALDNSEATLREFGQQKGIAAPDDERTDLALQVTNFIGTLHSTRQSIASDEERIRSDQRQMEATPQRSATLEVSNSADLLLQQLGQSLLASEMKRTQLLLKYEPSYPLVREADQEIAGTKAAIDDAQKAKYVNQTTDRDPTFELLREDLAKTRADLAAQRASETKVKEAVKTMQSQMVDLDKQSIEQADIKREVKANEDNYLLYLNKREQERVSDALDTTRIGNVAIATPPAVPVLPLYSPLLIVLSALCIASILSLVAAYGADYFDSSFHTSAEVINFLDIPIVVAVQKKSA
jgi:uncharacterized protein involved in exopolysaccharide biosynthesis